MAKYTESDGFAPTSPRTNIANLTFEQITQALDEGRLEIAGPRDRWFRARRASVVRSQFHRSYGRYRFINTKIDGEVRFVITDRMAERGWRGMRVAT